MSHLTSTTKKIEDVIRTYPLIFAAVRDIQPASLPDLVEHLKDVMYEDTIRAHVWFMVTEGHLQFDKDWKVLTLH